MFAARLRLTSESLRKHTPFDPLYHLLSLFGTPPENHLNSPPFLRLLSLLSVNLNTTLVPSVHRKACR